MTTSGTGRLSSPGKWYAGTRPRASSDRDRPTSVRVLYVIEALGEGGTEMSLAELLPGLRTRGVDPIIVTLKSRGEEGVERQLRSGGFDIRVLEQAGLIGREIGRAHV